MLLIREAKAADCTNLVALSVQVWLDTYAAKGIQQGVSEYALSTFTHDYFSHLLQSNDHRLLVAEEGEFIRGFALVNLSSHFKGQDNGFEVEHLYIHGPFQGSGVGKQLIQYIAQQLGKRFWLYTWIESHSNEFYTHMGLKHIGQHEFDFNGSKIDNNVYAYVEPELQDAQ